MNPQAAGAEPPEDHWASLMATSSEASEKQMLLSLAQQLALREQELLGRVKLVELQRLAFAKSNKAELAPTPADDARADVSVGAAAEHPEPQVAPRTRRVSRSVSSSGCSTTSESGASAYLTGEEGDEGDEG